MTHTPAQTAEQRARDIWAKCVRLPKEGPIALIASAITQAEEQTILRLRSADLSSEELKMADKHCDWVSFQCAFRAVMKSRSLKSQKETP